MGSNVTYNVHCIYVDSCLQEQGGLFIKALLGHTVQSSHVLLWTEGDAHQQ